TSSSPESWVLVVVDRMTLVDWAWTGVVSQTEHSATSSKRASMVPPPSGQQPARTAAAISPGPTKTTIARSPTRPCGPSRARAAPGPARLEAVAERRSRSPNVRLEPSARPTVYCARQYETEVTWRAAGACLRSSMAGCCAVAAETKAAPARPTTTSLSAFTIMRWISTGQLSDHHYAPLSILGRIGGIKM